MAPIAELAAPRPLDAEAAPPNPPASDALSAGAAGNVPDGWLATTLAGGNEGSLAGEVGTETDAPLAGTTTAVADGAFVVEASRPQAERAAAANTATHIAHQ